MNDTMPKIIRNWSEIRTDFVDDNQIHVDAWTSEDENEDGRVIARIDATTGVVTYIDERAITDPLAQECIELVLKDFCFNI